MTTPQQPVPRETPPQPDTAQDAAAVAVIATALTAAVTAAAALTFISARMRLQRDKRAAMLAALEVVMAMPPESLGVTGSATIATSRLNTIRRAQFAWNAAGRLVTVIRDARAHGQPVNIALAAAIAAERRYFGLHMDAMRNRMQAAMNTDMASWSYGDLLGWYTTMDAHTSAECRAANGRNFYASAPPLIGYPGAVHPHCRCMPGPAHEGASLLPSARRERVLVRA